MKIFIVSHNASLTGASKLAFESAYYFSKKHDVTIISKIDGPLFKIPKYKRLKSKITNISHEFGPFHFRHSVKEAKSIIRNKLPDIIYCNSGVNCDWCVAASKLNIPNVLHLHEMKNELITLSRANIFKFDIPNYVDLLITAANDILYDLNSLNIRTFKQTYNFGVFVDVENILSKSEDSTPAPTNAKGNKLRNENPLIAMCGTGCSRKGADIFFSLACNLSDINFLWIGPWFPNEFGAHNNPAYESFLRRKIDNFYVTGLVENPYPFIKLCDFFLLSSREDPNPITIYEALVLGKKCVCFSDTGGSKDVLKRYGYVLFGSVELDRLTKFIPKLLNNNKKDMLGIDSVKEIQNTYDIKTKMKELENVLQKLIDR